MASKNSGLFQKYFINQEDCLKKPIHIWYGNATIILINGMLFTSQ